MTHTSRSIRISDIKEFIDGPLDVNGETEYVADWLIEGLLINQGFNILGGVPKVGKSLLRSHLLVCAIVGTPACSSFAVRPIKKALLLAGEESVEAEKSRLRRAARGLGVDNILLAIDILPQFGLYFDDPEAFESLRDLIMEEKYDLVCIDPLVRWHRRNENSSGELSPILTQLRSLCHAGITILLIHHVSKPHDNQDTSVLGYLLRGTSDFAAIYDNLIIMKKGQGGSKTRRTLQFDCRPAEAPDPRPIELKAEQQSFTWVDHRPAIDVLRDLISVPIPGGVGTETGKLDTKALARAIGRRNVEVTTALQLLAKEGLVKKDGKFWHQAVVPL